MEEYPELAAKLLPIKIAMEWLEGANHQLEQLWGNKTFSQMGPLIMRDSSGLRGDNPLQREDPYLYLNLNLIDAFSVLNLRRLARHINTMITRDSLLAAATPHKSLQEKTTRRAQKEGRTGGEVKAKKYKPLHEEIKRLFFLEKSINPGRTLKFYASQIEQEVELFIKQDPEPYKQIGSESDGIRDYHNYIARKLSSLNSNEADKK
ncbi:MAG: hypothetical protein ACRC6F_07145 [Aeromonas sp.]